MVIFSIYLVFLRGENKIKANFFFYDLNLMKIYKES